MPDIRLAASPAAINLRGAGDGFAVALYRTTGLSLPQPNRLTTSGNRSLLWLGPDEWLLLDPDADGTDLEAEMATSLAPDARSVCDVTGNRVTVTVTGRDAAAFLARGCSLDLAALPAGTGCAQTLVARAQVILIRTAADRFDIMPRLSFAHYLTSWLGAALPAD